MFGGPASSSAKAIAPGPARAILELPDLSSIHLEARLDESDRGRLKVGQQATVKIEAVPGKDFAARVDLISVLARVDFSSGWPPVRELRSRPGSQDPDPRDPSRHDRDRAHRHRTRAGRDCSCRPRRSSSTTAVRSSTGCTARCSTSGGSTSSGAAASRSRRLGRRDRRQARDPAARARARSGARDETTTRRR